MTVWEQYQLAKTAKNKGKLCVISGQVTIKMHTISGQFLTQKLDVLGFLFAGYINKDQALC